MNVPIMQLPDHAVAQVLISGLIDEFFARVDRRESTADLWTEEASFATRNRAAKGRTEVADLLLQLADVREERGRESRHFAANVSVKPLGENRYQVRSLIVVVSADSQPEPAGVLNTGDHDDIVEIDASGHARFVTRNMTQVHELGLLA